MCHFSPQQCLLHNQLPGSPGQGHQWQLHNCWGTHGEDLLWFGLMLFNSKGSGGIYGFVQKLQETYSATLHNSFPRFPRAQYTPSQLPRRPWTGPLASCGGTAVAPARTSSPPPLVPPRLWGRWSPSLMGEHWRCCPPDHCITCHLADSCIQKRIKASAKSLGWLD